MKVYLVSYPSSSGPYGSRGKKEVYSTWDEAEKRKLELSDSYPIQTIWIEELPVK